MGHCQKSQNNTHQENQILQKSSDCQSVRVLWACPCAQVTAQEQQQQIQTSPTQGWWGDVVTPPRSQQGGAHPWNPGAHQLQVSSWRTTQWELLQESEYTAGGSPKAFCQRQSGHHSRSWFWFQISQASTQEWLRHWDLCVWDFSAQHWAGLRSGRANSAGMPSRSKHLEPASPTARQRAALSNHSPAAEPCHQKRGRWDCDSREGDKGTWLPRWGSRSHGSLNGQKNLVHRGTSDTQKGRKEVLEAKLRVWGKETEHSECSLKTLPVTLCRTEKIGKKRPRFNSWLIRRLKEQICQEQGTLLQGRRFVLKGQMSLLHGPIVSWTAQTKKVVSRIYTGEQREANKCRGLASASLRTKPQKSRILM